MFTQNDLFVITLTVLVLLFIWRTWKTSPRRKTSRAAVLRAVEKLLDEEKE